MMKKILIVAVLLAVMLPLAAADNNGKWFVDLTYNYSQPAGMDTTYAVAYGYNDPSVDPPANGIYYFTKTKTWDVATPRAWSPQVRFGYDCDKWTGWVSYSKFSKTGSSHAEVPAGFEILFNTLSAPEDPLFDDTGFIYSDAAYATQMTRNTNWDANIGRKFHPTDKWNLVFYTGVKYLKLEATVDAIYTDNFDANDWGPGSQDEVVLQSRSTGWGLNAGLISNTDIGKYVTVSGGLEFSAVHTSRVNTQSEYYWSSYYSPTNGAFGSWTAYNSNAKVIPVASLFVEGQVKMGEHFYGKMGYKFTTIQNAFTFTKLVNDYPFGAFGYVEQNKDLSFDGMYFTVGFKF